MVAQLLERLEGKTSTLFLVAGALLVVFGVLNGVQAATAFEPTGVFGPAGYTVAFVALLGLYPALAGRTPWLARAGGVGAAVGVIGWALVTVLTLLASADVTAPPEELGAVGGVAMALTGLGMVAGYVLVGVACLRSAAHPRALGVLLIAPAAIFALVFAVFAPLGYGEEWGPFVAGSAQALVHLAIGFLLRRQASPERSGRVRRPTGEGAPHAA